ncbi:nucleotidyltransferase domain-containing protein [Thermodesulfovibrio sp. N1]|uniref:nucleotidyltransferase domain-containing protein n=1 Tax=Thermodesulfovibrio sp. N1 TaxID=1871110 RepID=UPI00083A7E45|nr:nucleotidyltransferase domain-containing protein [Thermodesulfovibrio sp. N1]
MKTYFYIKLTNKLSELIEKIKVLYKENLIAIVLFGSAARGDFSQSSDIDLLLILKDSIESKRQRILDFYEKVGYEFENHFLSPIILTQKELSEYFPFCVGILKDHKVLYDDENIVGELIKMIDKKKQNKEIIEKEFKGMTYWIIK